MAKDLHDDNLESFFRSELNKVNENPPDSAWEHIAAHTQKPDKHRPKVLFLQRRWLIAASLLLFIVSASLALFRLYQIEMLSLGNKVVSQEQQIKSLEQVVDTLKTQLAQNPTTTSVLENPSKKIANDKTPLIKNDLTKTGQPTNKAIPTLAKTTITPIENNNINKNITTQNIQILATQEQPNATKQANSQTPAPSQIAEQLPSQTPHPSTALPSISLAAHISPATKPKLDIEKNAPNILPLAHDFDAILQKDQATFSLGAYFSPLYSYRTVKDGNTPPPRPSNQLNREEQANFSYEAGLKATWHFAPRWSLGTGISYANIQQTSEPQLIKIDYDSTREEDTSEGAASRYSVDVATSYGNHRIRCNFVRDRDQTIPHGEKIELAFQIREKLQTLSLPLTAKYELPLGKFRVGVLAGGRYNYLVATETSINNFKSKDRPNHFVRQDAKIELDSLAGSGLRKHQVDWQLGAEISYSLSPNVSVSVAPNYRRALTPIYTTTQQSSTKPYALGVQLGLNYYF